MEYNIEELILLVRELTDNYTGKESTSITYEAAQQLMGAVLYCIKENDLETRNGGPKETVVTNPRYFPTAREAYQNGYLLVIDKIRKANERYTDILEDFKDYGNLAYYDTVIKGIPEFFRWYNPRLNPVDHIIMIDYTVIEPLYDLEGVDLIYRYLTCIELEQIFLKKIPEAYVREVLILYYNDYEEMFINICGTLLKKLLANRLIGVPIEKVRYESVDYEKMAEVVNSASKEELEARLYYHLEWMVTNVYQGDHELYHYLAYEVPNISTELRNAVKNNSLHNIT